MFGIRFVISDFKSGNQSPCPFYEQFKKLSLIKCSVTNPFEIFRTQKLWWKNQNILNYILASFIYAQKSKSELLSFQSKGMFLFISIYNKTQVKHPQLIPEFVISWWQVSELLNVFLQKSKINTQHLYTNFHLQFKCRKVENTLLTHNYP